MALVDRVAREHKTTPEKVEKLVFYLKYFGYLPSEPQSESQLETAIIDFQEMVGLEKNGEVNPKVLRAIDYPRCGVTDKMMANAEFAQWNKNHIRYCIKRRDSDISQAIWDSILADAWRQWSVVAKLTFEQVTSTSNADVVCDVGTGRADGFDGPQGVLAWAELPNGNRQLQMKFDASETWIDNPTKMGILLLNVACHEFGHSLGLDHSRVKTALMAPYYSPSVTKPQKNDDATRMAALYGEPETPVDPPLPPPPIPPTDDIVTLRVNKNYLEIPGYRLVKAAR